MTYIRIGTVGAMDPEVKDMWVKALESGEYSQTKDGGLRDRDDNYCCLGVLCDIAVREGAIPEPVAPVEEDSPESDEGRETEWYTYVTGESDRDTAFLPQAVMTWSGLPSPNGELSNDAAAQLDSGSLTLLNDSGATFVDIANVVRNYF